MAARRLPATLISSSDHPRSLTSTLSEGGLLTADSLLSPRHLLAGWSTAVLTETTH